jgi:hypothetical protein
MKIATAWSTAPCAAAAVAEAFGGLVAKLGAAPEHLLIYFTEAYRADALVEAAGALPAGIRVHGGSSCRFVMTEAGVHGEDGCALALFGICDPRGSYGVGVAALGEAPRRAAAAALCAALDDAGRPGELPAMIWMNASPGNEEQLLAGISDLVGTGVPVLGGSVADDMVAGRWHVLTREAALADGVVISVLFPSGPSACSFQSGYTPAAASGTVTAASGRIVHRIDDRPAAEVYREWSGTLLDAVPPEGGNVLELTALAPLGRVLGRIGDVAYYALSHPNALLADGAMSLFTEVVPGERLTLMSGSTHGLVSRAGRVVGAAMRLDGVSPARVRGAVIVYCAGCMLAVRERMAEVVGTLDAALGQRPFIGIFTFGEQGCLVAGAATHANLMISSMVFAE